MEIIIDGAYKKPNYTISHVIIDGDRQPYNVMEDADRGLTSLMDAAYIRSVKAKYPKATRIPKGRYEVSNTWSNRFKRMMLLLNGVKGFAGIRVHSGNTEKDSEGCLLVGKNDVKGKITNSRYWTKVFETKVLAALKKEKVYITIQ